MKKVHMKYGIPLNDRIICLIGIPLGGEKEKGIENLLNEIIVEYFPALERHGHPDTISSKNPKQTQLKMVFSKVYCHQPHAANKKFTSKQRYTQTESEGMEKDTPGKWKSKVGKHSHPEVR